MLRRVTPQEIRPHEGEPVDPATREIAARLVERVRAGGEAAIRQIEAEVGVLPPEAPLVIEREELDRALADVGVRTRELLQAAGERIRAFAVAQRGTIRELSMDVPGARVGHSIAPVERAGCYAPGGRYPLPSSVLMTAVTARAAGCPGVTVATPSRDPVMLAAAAVAGADRVLNIGGAQAVAALACGIPGVLEPCDAVAGPGNRFVTAAKQLVAGRVAIDMLAGPSEVLVIADETADAATVASDLLAQAEHDTDARVYLLTTSAALADAVDAELAAQLEGLPTAETARAALSGSVCCVCASTGEAVAVSDRIAPEHLEIQTADAASVAAKCAHYGAIFVGHGAAEAIGDYGIGPNHTLPTGGTARAFGGLSVFTFLRVRTFIEADRADPELARQTAALARLEGLEAHARSAERRL